jgi:predicted nucleic acid-binding protein
LKGVVVDASVALAWCFPDEADAAYLELSIRHGAPLATLDARLQTAAQKAGVEIFAGGSA